MRGFSLDQLLKDVGINPDTNMIHAYHYHASEIIPYIPLESIKISKKNLIY